MTPRVRGKTSPAEIRRSTPHGTKLLNGKHSENSNAHSNLVGRKERLNSDTEAKMARDVPPVTRANTVSSISTRSPVSRKQASIHLAGIIERHQEKEKERSNTPSPSPLTPTSFESKRTFTFSDEHMQKSLDSQGSNGSTLVSATTVKTNLTLVASTAKSKPEAAEASNSEKGQSSEVQNSRHVTKGSDIAKRHDPSCLHPNSGDLADRQNISRDKPVGPQASNAPVTKSQVVFRPINVSLAEDITYVPGSFCDASQDGDEGLEEEIHVETDSTPSVGGVLGRDEDVKGKDESVDKDTKAKGKKSKGKKEEKKSILRLSKKSNKEKDEDTQRKSFSSTNEGSKSTPTPRRASKDTPQISSSSSEKLSKQFTPDAVSPKKPIPTSKPPLPATPTHSKSPKPRQKSLDSLSIGLIKGSLPDLTSPSHLAYGGSQGNRGSTRSFSSSRGSTPDSMTSETDTKNQRRGSKAKKAPLTRRLSLSIQNLVKKGRFHGDVARNDSGPVLLGYRTLDLNENTGGMVSAHSEMQLTSMTENEREEFTNDTEVVPRTYSLECLLSQKPSDKQVYRETAVETPQYQERSVDYEERSVDEPRVVKMQPPKVEMSANCHDNSSDNEYKSCSDSESVGPPSVKIDTIPTDSQLQNCEKPKSEVGILSNNEKSLKNQTWKTELPVTHSPKPVQKQTKSPSSPAGSPIAKQRITVSSHKTTPKVESPETKKKSSAASQPSDIVQQEQQETTAKLSTPTSNLTDRLSPDRNSGRGHVQFTRFTKERVPIRKRNTTSPRSLTPSSASSSPRSSSRAPSRLSVGSNSSLDSRSRTPTNQSMAEKAEQTKSQRKSDVQGVNPVSKSIYQGSSSSPLATKRAVSTSSTPSLTKVASKTPPHTPPQKSPVVGGSRKRRVGLSGPSPISSPASVRKTNGVSSSPKTSPKTDKKVVNKNGRSPKVSKGRVSTNQKRDSEMGLDVSNLLASVGKKLLNVSPPPSETGSSSKSKLILESDLGPKPAVLKKGDSKPQPTIEPLSFSPPLTSPPALASMPADVFAPFSPTSSTHSRQSSFDGYDVQPSSTTPQIVITPENSPILSRRNPGGTAAPEQSLATKAVEPLHKSIMKKTVSQKTTSHGTPPPVRAVKVKVVQVAEKQKIVTLKTNKTQEEHSCSKGPTPHSPVPTSKYGKGLKTAQKDLPSAKNTTPVPLEKTPSNRRVSAPFTSSLPPIPPSGRKDTPVTSASKVNTVERPAPSSVQDTKMSSRFSPLRLSKRKSIATVTSNTVTAATKSRSSISATSASPLRSSKRSMDTSGKQEGIRGPRGQKIVASKSATNVAIPKKDSTFPRRKSLRLKSSTLLRPTSATSTHSVSSTGSRDSRGSTPSIRQSMRRVSSGEVIVRKMIKPGASATLTRERRPSQAAVNLNASMRLPRSRPRSGSLFSRSSPASMSLRVRNPPNIGHRVSTGTLPRMSTLSRKATPPLSVSGAIQSSPARLSMRRASSAKEVFAVFDQISADAQGSM